jgi:hypothetical protein
VHTISASSSTLLDMVLDGMRNAVEAERKRRWCLALKRLLDAFPLSAGRVGARMIEWLSDPDVQPLAIELLNMAVSRDGAHALAVSTAASDMPFGAPGPVLAATEPPNKKRKVDAPSVPPSTTPPPHGALAATTTGNAPRPGANLHGPPAAQLTASSSLAGVTNASSTVLDTVLETARGFTFDLSVASVAEGTEELRKRVHALQGTLLLAVAFLKAHPTPTVGRHVTFAALLDSFNALMIGIDKRIWHAQSSSGMEAASADLVWEAMHVAVQCSEELLRASCGGESFPGIPQELMHNMLRLLLAPWCGIVDPGKSSSQPSSGGSGGHAVRNRSGQGASASHAHANAASDFATESKSAFAQALKTSTDSKFTKLLCATLNAMHWLPPLQATDMRKNILIAGLKDARTDVQLAAIRSAPLFLQRAGAGHLPELMPHFMCVLVVSHSCMHSGLTNCFLFFLGSLVR